MSTEAEKEVERTQRAFQDAEVLLSTVASPRRVGRGPAEIAKAALNVRLRRIEFEGALDAYERERAEEAMTAPSPPSRSPGRDRPSLRKRAALEEK